MKALRYAGFVALTALTSTLTALSYITHPDQKNETLDKLKCRLVGHQLKTSRTFGDSYCARCYTDIPE